MKSSAAADPNRLRIVDLTATCKHCARIERDAKLALELAAANYLRMSAEVDRLNRALQRESYVMDSREPHRRKV